MKDLATVLNTITDVLEHVQTVENDVKEETKKRTIELSKFLENEGVEPTKEILDGIQYQDILSQQLTATSDAMNHICKTIRKYQHAINKDAEILEDNIKMLDNKLKNSLDEAKEKRNRFNGKLGKDDDESLEEIEFF
ncbi:MAG: hypothetical protein OIF32_01600 [Campylobacterales bacterium]|nr:hypothetical protein [Campylobacterales bacterium]